MSNLDGNKHLSVGLDAHSGRLRKDSSHLGTTMDVD